jgi:hypothetical protein
MKRGFFVLTRLSKGVCGDVVPTGHKQRYVAQTTLETYAARAKKDRFL